MTWLAAAEEAHRHAVTAAIAGMSDPALGSARLTGQGLAALAEAAVSSATPFLRAPLLASISDALRLHPAVDAEGARRCPTCDVPAPCSSRVALSPVGHASGPEEKPWNWA